MQGVFSFLLLITLGSSAWSAPPPRIESIVGESSTPAYSKEGLRTLNQGQSLQVGEELRTTSKSAIRIVFASGAEVSLGPNTRAGILATGTQADWIFVRSGTIKIKVPEKTNLGIRSRTLVAGLRATKATLRVSQDERLSQIAVHEGSVQIASDVKGFASPERRQRINSGQFAFSSREGLQKPRKLDEKKFLAHLGKRSPSLVKLTRSKAKPYAQLASKAPSNRAPASVPKKQRSKTKP